MIVERTPTLPRGYKVVTWGCQMNVEDSEQMESILQGLGLPEANSMENAEVVLLNTCSVRNKPEDKAFSMMGVLAAVKERNPDLIIGVCGCMAQLRGDEIRRRAPHVDFVVGTAQISQISALIAEARQSKRFAKRLDLPERRGAIVTDIPKRVVGKGASKLRAFVPIQYGCDKFCTFCIVPTTRGRERSRPTGEILDEIRILASRGTKEVTLLGQTVNSYGKNLLEGKVPFARLLWDIAAIKGIERIRYISPYPRDFKDDLISAHRDCPQVMEHCHLPLQAGDDEMLRMMRRVYTVESFEQIYRNLRAVPGLAITTDVIVGFPGETEEMFHGTMAVMERLRFDSAFMFAYSPRPGTPAAILQQVPVAVKKRRLNELIDLQNSITAEINRSEVGSTFEVLVEGPSQKNPDLLKGMTRHFKTVHFPVAARTASGGLLLVRTEQSHPWGFSASVL